MNINVSVEIQPFTIPRSVTVISSPGRRQDGIKPAHTIDLDDLSIETLIELCDDFKTRIMNARKDAFVYKIRQDDPTGY